MAHIEYGNNVVHLHNIARSHSSPYINIVKNKESLILGPRSTPSSTPISNSLVLIHNCQHAQASNARIHWLDESTELEVSTLALSTLDIKLTVHLCNHLNTNYFSHKVREWYSQSLLQSHDCLA